MRRCFRFAFACCAVLLLGACASTTTLEPQSKPLDARQARLYFIRQPTILSGLGSADIKVDGKLVGSLAAGTFIVVDRPPGPHTVTVYGLIDPNGSESDIQVETGGSYYYELGPIVRMNIDLFKLDSMGVTGRPVANRHGVNSPFMFYALDATAGAASVARLSAKRS